MPVASTSSALWVARPGDGTLRTVVRFTSRLCMACLNNAAAARPPWLSATSTNKLEKVQLVAARAITCLVRSTPVEAVLAESHQPPISTYFQTISLLKADEWANLPPADGRRQVLLTASRQHQNRKDRRNTQYLCLNQLGLCPHVLTQTPSSCEQLSFPSLDKPYPIQTVISQDDKIMSPSQQRPCASNPYLHSPSGLPDLHTPFGSRWNHGRRCRFGSPQPKLSSQRMACTHGHP